MMIVVALASHVAAFSVSHIQALVHVKPPKLSPR